MSLAIAKGVNLPTNGVTQTFGFVARKGAGKTYAAGRLVEELHRIHAPAIVLDPVGNWYGLRLAADGKRAGLPIPVFGGENGDVPLAIDQGERLATLLVERNLSAVVDVSAFRKGERKRFVADFADALFHAAKRNKSPRMIVFEEAQVFAPQRVDPGEQRMLGAVEDIVRLGRNYGLGSTLISQRPQSVNKEVLNQVEALFVGQLSGPQERKAIEEWVGERRAKSKVEVSELPSLPVGTMLLWSPQWLQTFQRVQILPKWTYDASATPELGKLAERVSTLTDIDVEALKAALHVEPTRAKGQAATAKAQTSPAGPRVPSVLGEQHVHGPRAGGDQAGARKRERYSVERTYGTLIKEVRQRLGELDDALERLERFEGQAALGGPRAVGVTERPAPLTSRAREPVPRSSGTATSSPTTRSSATERGGRKLLLALATFWPGQMTRAQVAHASDMKAGGGAFSSYWSELKKAGFIEATSGGYFRCTGAGLAHLGAERPTVPKTLEDRVNFWCARLKATEQSMLRVLVEHAGGVSRAELACAVGMTASGGAFNSYVGTLLANNLARRQGNVLVMHPWLQHGAEHAQ